MSVSSVRVNDFMYDIMTTMPHFKKFYRLFISHIVRLQLIGKQLDPADKNNVYTFFDEFGRRDRRSIESMLQLLIIGAVRYYKTNDVKYQQYLKRKRQGRVILI